MKSLCIYADFQLLEARESALHASLSAARQRADEAEARLAETRRQYADDCDDWNELRRDLQTAVVVAETIRSEAQDSLDLLMVENRALKTRIETLVAQLDAAAAAASKSQEQAHQSAGALRELVKNGRLQQSENCEHF